MEEKVGVMQGIKKILFGHIEGNGGCDSELQETFHNNNKIVNNCLFSFFILFCLRASKTLILLPVLPLHIASFVYIDIPYSMHIVNAVS